jgi:hypothetical protein
VFAALSLHRESPDPDPRVRPLIPKVVLSQLPTLAHVPLEPTITERIIIRNYCCNKNCDEHTVDTLFTFDSN